MPHILDSSASGRNKYVEMFGEVAKSQRGKPFGFMWAEAGQQPALEEALGITQNFPTIAVMSIDKKAFAVQKLSWSSKNINTFLSALATGSEKTFALPKGAVPAITKVEAWDGKDATVEVNEEFSLADLMSD